MAWVLSQGLSELGHDVALVTPQGSTPPNDKVEIIPTVNLKNQAYQENTAVQYYADRVKDFDCVIDHSHAKFISYYIKDNELGVAYLPVVHNMTTIAYPIRKPSIIALSKAHAEWLEQRHGYKCKYIYNGLRTSDFKPIVKRKLKGNRYFICGRPNPEKNLLEAIDLCKKANVPCDVIAGRMSIEPSDYAVKVAQACTFGSPWKYVGTTNHQDKNRIMARAKATLITYGGRDSRSWYVEPFGLVPVESMLCGTPVVGYDCGAFKEIVRHGKDGFVIPRNDQEEFLKAMREVDSLDLEEIREHAARRFSHTRMAKDYVKLAEEKLGGVSW